VSVKLAMGRNDDEVADVVASAQFDAIFLSVAQGAQLAAVGKLVEKIRAASPRATPIVLGGSVVTRVTDARAQTGADHATTDAREALRACGLTVSASGARPRVTSE
jgi:MerR family transcriptional regulator, light-induced transcriptional regulator